MSGTAGWEDLPQLNLDRRVYHGLSREKTGLESQTTLAGAVKLHIYLGIWDLNLVLGQVVGFGRYCVCTCWQNPKGKRLDGPWAGSEGDRVALWC